MTKVTNYQREVANWTEFSLATVSLVCALLTLLTVAFMKSWNGYIALICSMVFFQILYDINFILGVCPGYAACVTWNFLDVLGGLSVSFWSNAISFVIMITVVKTRSFNVFKNYWKFSFFAIVLPLVVAIMAMFVIVPASSDDDEPFTYCAYRESTLAEVVGGLYYWGRILSIIFNVGVFAYTSARINGMRITPPIPRQGSDVTGSDRSVGMRPSRRQDISTENQNMAVYTLISRIKYYPIAQVISRSGACWNAFDNYKFSTYPSVMFNAVTGPILGLLCFIIFLVMQPTARTTLYSIFTCQRAEKKPPVNQSSLFRGSMCMYSEDDLDNIINEDITANSTISVENSILTSAYSGNSQVRIQQSSVDYM